MTVGNKTYVGDTVQDGFFDSISQLKSRDSDSLAASKYFDDFSRDYENILEVCKHGKTIPAISEEDSFELLQSMKPSVNDLYGVTVNHYKFAGPAGWKHFHILINSLLNDVNNTSIAEINTVYACILFKGHKKDKSSDRSYRTISTCPVIAKALDVYIRNLYIDSWNNDQAETQFQGEGSSHELAAVLLTETIQHSIHALKQPIYLLYLDAQSAFDVVLRELLVRNLYNCNTNSHALLYINNRLGNRKTFIDWDGQLMGPIHDENGLEQGGVNSSDFYKIFGKEQLTTAQDSELGVPLGNLTVSAIGQADDTALISNSIQNLQLLLLLSQSFCKRYQVKLCAEKTKLQVFFTKDMKVPVEYAKNTNPIYMNGKKIDFVDTAEHVGMLRSSAGNLLTILARITAHKKALGGVLHTGMARGHRGNPAASLRVDQLHGVPVLLSGLATLFLSKKEEDLIALHHKETLQGLLRLFPLTPRSVVCFLAGSLPGEALLHLRQLSIFGMICRLPENILHRHAVNYFSSTTSSPKSWFSQIRSLCLQYHLPHPLEQLRSPLLKATFRNTVKKKVISHWESVLRDEASSLDSLSWFKPSFMSLMTPHPLWITAGSSPSKIAMATIQAKMISGRYRTERLCSHWSKNKDGFCLLSSSCVTTVEDLPHILSSCSALTATRDKLMNFTIEYGQSVPPIAHLITEHCTPSSPTFCQFLLDCSTIPDVLLATQTHGTDVLFHLFNITRTWVYSLHKERMKLLGRWNCI